MRHHRLLFEKVRKHPGMYFQDESYGVTAAFVLGYDEACEGGALAGFREWLVLRIGTGSNLSWPALVLHAAFPGVDSPQNALSSAEAHRHAVAMLFQFIDEFDDAREKHGGVERIYVDYHNWIRRREP